MAMNYELKVTNDEERWKKTRERIELWKTDYYRPIELDKCFYLHNSNGSKISWRLRLPFSTENGIDKMCCIRLVLGNWNPSICFYHEIIITMCVFRFKYATEWLNEDVRFCLFVFFFCFCIFPSSSIVYERFL